MADVVALELEARAVRLSQLAEDLLDVAEGVPEDQSSRSLRHRRCSHGYFHSEMPRADLVEGEVHRAHVQRTEFGPRLERIGEALVERHARAAAGRDVDDGVGLRRDPRHELIEHRRVGRRAAVARIARVQVQDGGARVRGFDRLLGDLVRRNRQVFGHGRGVDRTGDGAGDDDPSLPPSHHPTSRSLFSEVLDVSVDADGLPGDVACEIRRQEHREIRHVLGLDHAPKRNLAEVGARISSALTPGPRPAHRSRCPSARRSLHRAGWRWPGCLPVRAQRRET